MINIKIQTDLEYRRYVDVNEIFKYKDSYLRAVELTGHSCSDCYFAYSTECDNVPCGTFDSSNVMFQKLSEIEVLVLQGDNYENSKKKKY